MKIADFNASIKELPNYEYIITTYMGGNLALDYFPLLDGFFHFLRYQTYLTQKKIEFKTLNTNKNRHSIYIIGDNATALANEMIKAYDDYNPKWEVKQGLFSIDSNKNVSSTGKTEEDRTTQLKNDLMNQLTMGGTVFQGQKKLAAAGASQDNGSTVGENINDRKNKILIEQINRIKKLLDNE